MIINATINSAGAPAGFASAVDDAIQYFEKTFTNQLTLNITFDWGSVGGVAETFTYLNAYSYSSVIAALAGQDNGIAADRGVVLPSSDPFPAGTTANYAIATPANTLWLTNAEATVLGLSSYNSSATNINQDATITLNSGNSYNFNPALGGVAGEYDAAPLLEHEISEVMGRQLGGNNSSDDGLLPEPLALFRYSSPGVVDTSDNYAGGYFSIDGGKTDLRPDMGEQNGDLADWGGPASDDVVGYAQIGVAQSFTPVDVQVMEALGWDPTDTTPPSLVHEGSVSVAIGGSVVLPESQLEFDDNVSTHAQETYTVVTAPADGVLLKSGSAVSTFTQADIDNGLISYQENGAIISSDEFTFKVADAAGNQTTVQQFQFQIANVPLLPTSDFNVGDGMSDILWSNTTTGDRAIWYSNGSGDFTPQDLGVVSMNWQIAGTGDFDGNGLADILWSNTTGDRAIWYSNGSGGFTPQDLGVVSTNWQIAGTGDFDGNGLADILWSNTNGDTAIWYSNGAGGFTPQDLGVVSTNWQIAGTGDFKGNGLADILWSNTTTGDRAIWYSNGSGGFTNQDLGVVSTDWQIAGTGDFDGNGLADILWRNSATGDTTIWDSNGSGGFTSEDLGIVSTNWKIAGVGDFNRNGLSGILWGNNPTGDTTTWV